jgi:hypothetical protein
MVPGAMQMLFSPSAFGRFIDQCAVAGVEIAGRAGQKATNLGYYGSYIYWFVEIVLVAGIAAAIIASVAAAPFCAECGTWKTSRKLGRVNVPRALALEAITSGEIIRLAGQDIGAGPGRLSLEVTACPNCGSAAPVDVSFKEVTADSKGNEKQKQIAHVTYPGEALEVLEALFKTDSQGGIEHIRPASQSRPAPLPDAGPRERILLRPAKKKSTETWRLELGEDEVFLINSEEQLMGAIPRSEATGRFIFPSFWESVRNLGVLTDEGKVVWFERNKTAIRQIKKYLKA